MNTQHDLKSCLLRQLSSVVLAAIAMAPDCTRVARRRSEAADDDVFLFTSFRDNGEDGLRFVWSEDGYQWTGSAGHVFEAARRAEPVDARSEPAPRAGRHVSTWCGPPAGEAIRALATRTRRTSSTGREQQFIPVMEHEPTTVNVWAPELFYDEPNERVHHLLGVDDSRPLSGSRGAARQQSADVLHDDPRLQNVRADEAVLRSRTSA